MKGGFFWREKNPSLFTGGHPHTTSFTHVSCYSLSAVHLGIMFSDGSLSLYARITICSHIRCGTGSAWLVGAMNCLKRA